MAFGSSLDQVSPLTLSARDAALVYDVLAGPDPRDATTLASPPEPPRPAPSLAGLRIGVLEEAFAEGTDPAVETRVRAALAELEEHGARCVPVRLPATRHALSTYYVIATAEASSNLARYDGVRYGMRETGDGTLTGMMAATREAGFGEEVKRRILLGTYVLSSGFHDAWYGRALRVRAMIAEEYRRAFQEVDLIAGPTSPTPAFRLGERADPPDHVPLGRAHRAGQPGRAAGHQRPCGLVDGARPLPVGMQLVGPLEGGARVLEAAIAFQERTSHHLRRPAPVEAGA